VSLRRNDGFDDKFVKADAGDAKRNSKSLRPFSQGEICPRMNRGDSPTSRKSRQARLAQGSVSQWESMCRPTEMIWKAYVWYALAQRNHYKHSDRRMKDLAEKMTQNIGRGT